jgi:hypothetical protein
MTELPDISVEAGTATKDASRNPLGTWFASSSSLPRDRLDAPAVRVYGVLYGNGYLREALTLLQAAAGELRMLYSISLTAHHTPESIGLCRCFICLLIVP